MKRLFTRKTLGTAVAFALLTACGGASNGSVPSASSALQDSGDHVGSGAKPLNLSGDYKGKFQDDAYGSGKATASYAQSGASVGGVLTVKYAKSTITASVVQVAGTSGVTGQTVAGSGSLYCTFATTGTYDAKTYTLSGKYTAVYGCTGENGTFTLKQQCHYKNGGTFDMRPEVGPKGC